MWGATAISRSSAIAILVGAGFVFGAARSPGDETSSSDPLLPFSTFLGGSGSEADSAMAIGPDGALWIAASSFSVDFHGAERPEAAAKPEGIVVLRFDPATRKVLSSLWLAYGTPEAVRFDSSGNAFVAGSTTDPWFPVTAGIPAPPRVIRDMGHGHLVPDFNQHAFLVKIEPGGARVAWSALIGGSTWERGAGLAIAPNGDAILVGDTGSTDFPLANPLQNALAGDEDAFVSRILADGSGFAFSTYLGKEGKDYAQSVALLRSGNLLLTGETRSVDFPSSQRILGSSGGSREGYLLEMDPMGTAVVRGARLGATEAWGTLVESESRILLWGITGDVNFPAPYAPHGATTVTTDVFLLRLDSGDWSIHETALYGGSAYERPAEAALAADGTIWIGGDTRINYDLPVPGAVRALPGGFVDAFAAAFAPEDLSLVTATFLGGENADMASALVVDGDGAAWIVGDTSSGDFPLSAPLQTRGMDGYFSDLFLARLLRGDPAGRPAVAGDPSAQVQEDGSVLLAWEDRSSNETGFAVYRREVDPQSGYEPSDTGFRRVASLPAGTQEWVDGDLVPGRTYGWAVQAFNDAGGSAATAVAGVDLPELLAVTITKGTCRNLGDAGPQDIRIRGALTTKDGSPEGVPDPRLAGFASELGRRDSLPGSVRTVIAAGDAGWKGTGRQIRWNDPSFRLQYDRRSGRFDLRLRAEKRVVGAGEPQPLVMRLGGSAGVAVRTWKAAGRNLLRAP